MWHCFFWNLKCQNDIIKLKFCFTAKDDFDILLRGIIEKAWQFYEVNSKLQTCTNSTCKIETAKMICSTAKDVLDILLRGIIGKPSEFYKINSKLQNNSTKKNYFEILRIQRVK